MRQHSSVVIAAGWTAGVGFPGGGSNGFFYLLHKVKTGSGAHPASYTMGNRPWRLLSLSRFLDNRLTDVGKIVIPMHRPRFIPHTHHFLHLVLISVRG
jgi:hypothetical protein